MIRIQEGLIKIVVILVNDYTYSIENRARLNSKVVSADMPERFRISVSILNSVSFFWSFFGDLIATHYKFVIPRNDS